MIRGAYVAIITPFHRNGKIDRLALEKFVAWQIEQGTDGILCCGATGEGITLSEGERRNVAAICVGAAEKKIPIIVGTGLAGTSETVRLTQQVEKIGASGCLVVTPYYNKPMSKGLIAHYQEVAKVGLPVIPYYNPGRTGLSIRPETLAQVCAIPGVAAVKDSSGDIEFIKRFRRLSPTPILSGDDHLTFDTLAAGGSGAISVIGNVFPKQWKRMIDLALQGRWEESKQLNDRYLPLCKAMFFETNPQCIKWTANWLGLAPGFLRLPLLEPEESTQQKIREKILKMGLPHLYEISQVH